MEPDASLLCPICLQLLVEPTMMACGHTACRLCLLRAVDTSREEGRLRCPVCFQDTGNFPRDVCQNYALQSIIESLHGKEVEQRRAEVNKEVHLSQLLDQYKHGKRLPRVVRWLLRRVWKMDGRVAIPIEEILQEVDEEKEFLREEVLYVFSNMHAFSAQCREFPEDDCFSSVLLVGKYAVVDADDLDDLLEFKRLDIDKDLLQVAWAVYTCARRTSHPLPLPQLLRKEAGPPGDPEFCRVRDFRFALPEWVAKVPPDDEKDAADLPPPRSPSSED